MKQLLLSLVFVSMIVSIMGQTKQYNPEWASLKDRPYPQWFTDSKLGIFIHWTPSSVPAWSGKEQYSEWFLRGLMTGDSARIKFQEQVFGKNFRYEEYIPLFKGELFNPDDWADLFRKAGARYVVFVSKHHDGFCLYPSRYAPGWNSYDAGMHRDAVGELTDAVRKAGLKMGLYYSLPEWTNPLYRWGTDDPAKVHEYVDKHMIPQFKELIGTYKPSLVFADGEWDHPASTWHSAELISWYYNLVGDDAIVNDRWGSGSDGIGFRTPEYSAGLVNSDRPWAEVRGLGRSFGLNRNEPLDAYMTPKDLVHFFVKAVANGGGMILNVGPYCDGQIPLLQQERLLQLGQWLAVNGEAIYGSKPYKKMTEEKDVILERVDQVIDFDWVRNSPGKPVSEDDFTAEWNGFINPAFSEEYRFDAEADDGMRLWIDGKLVLDQWEPGSTTGQHPADLGRILLQSHKLATIKLEYRELKQNASIRLKWSSKSQSSEIIPPNRFYTSELPDAPHGLNAIYRSKATRLCYTQHNGNLYAIALEYPADNRLILEIENPGKQMKVRMLGRAGDLPWKYENGTMIINLDPVRVAELPCEWAWVFRISEQ
jgi:alpha-L-fucosidase